MTHSADNRRVVDTDVVSFLFKRDSRAELYHPHLVSRLLIVSFMTVAELDFWSLTKNWGPARRTALDRHMRQFLVSPFDRDLCRMWAEVSDSARRQGRPITTADAWIAATARRYGARLVTHNSADYAGVTGLTVISEQSAGR